MDEGMGVDFSVKDGACANSLKTKGILTNARTDLRCGGLRLR